MRVYFVNVLVRLHVLDSYEFPWIRCVILNFSFRLFSFLPFNDFRASALTLNQLINYLFDYSLILIRILIDINFFSFLSCSVSFAIYLRYRTLSGTLSFAQNELIIHTIIAHDSIIGNGILFNFHLLLSK